MAVSYMGNPLSEYHAVIDWFHGKYTLADDEIMILDCSSHIVLRVISNQYLVFYVC